MSLNQLANIIINFLVYSDGSQSNNPKLRDIDYFRQFVAIPAGNPFSRRFDIPPGSTLSVIQTARDLDQDATTQYKVSLTTGFFYRWLFTGVGTNPLLREHRDTPMDETTEFDVSKSGDVIRYTAVGGTLPAFVASGVVVGDGVTIQPFSPFNDLNKGTFTIVSIGSDFFEVVNASGTAESGIVLGLPDTNGILPMDIYSFEGVQVSDNVRITSTGFSVENRGDFEVQEVTSQYFVVSNGNPGVEQTAVVGAVGDIVFYPDIYSWCYIESDKRVSVRINSDTSDNVQIEPRTSVIPPMPGVYLQSGGVFKLVIANNGLETAQVKVALVE
jgi:hypothetical protein